MSHGLLLTFELTILVLAIFLGFEVISKVPTLLHTPLMSGTNAIHGIVIVGAMLVAGHGHKDTLTTSSVSSPSCSRSANVVGGFVVTDRMLEMFKKREREADETLSAVSAHESSLPDHDRDVHPGVAVPVEPGDRAARQPDRRRRDARRDRRHVRPERDRQLLGDRARHGRSAAASAPSPPARCG